MQLYVRTSTSANCLPLPYGVIALSCDENVEARLSDPSVIVLNPVREWLSELCCNCERGTAAIRLVTSSSAVEKAVSGCDDVDLEVVAANLVDRAAEILGRKVRASYDRHVVYNDRCSTYERAVYSLVAAAEISFLRSPILLRLRALALSSSKRIASKAPFSSFFGAVGPACLRTLAEG